MSKYNTFLTLFVISIVAALFFAGFYMNGIFSFAFRAHENSHNNPLEIISTIFSPSVILSLVVAGIASLVSRIMGIVYVAKSKTISDGEKAIWIIGFVLISFITSIVFLIMAKGKKFVE